MTVRFSLTDDYSERLLRVVGGPWFSRAALLVAILIAAWLASDVFWRFALPSTPVRPVEAVPGPRQAVEQILAQHWMGKATAAVTSAEPAPGVKLRGVIAADAKGRQGMAIFAVEGGADKVVAVGDTIMPGVRLTAVRSGAVTVTRAGVEEKIELPKRGRP